MTMGATASVRSADIRRSVREYYGKVLAGRRDLKTSACCASAGGSDEHAAILSVMHPEIIERFYGCGSPIPPLLEGCTVLDLACGAGRDSYIVSKLVGSNGCVIGVDMTAEQVEVALRHVGEQSRRLGLARPNVSFHQGYMEDLAASGVEDESVDVVISNCAINLSPDKPRVFAEIFRVLKPGGELYFSDVFAGRRVPDELLGDAVLVGECLAGAMYVADFRRMLRDVGCLDYRIVARAPVQLDDREIRAKIGMVDFRAMTVRAFKLESLEDICEDYGQTAVYRGTIPGHEHRFRIDDHHEFVAGKPMLVCGNTASMLAQTRYGPHFRVLGDRRTHYGPFDCGPMASRRVDDAGTGGACC